MPSYTTYGPLANVLRFGSLLVLARLTVYNAGNPTQYTVPVSVATITVTRNSAHRRQCTLTAQIPATIPPQAILPINPSSLLAPFGNEVYIEIGIAPSGKVDTVTWVPLGLFVLATSTVDDTTIDLAVTIQGYDRSWVIAQRKFKQRYSFPAVTGKFVPEMKHLLNQVWGTTKPALRYNIVTTTATVPTSSFNVGSTPWTAALQMANAVGYELFFNATGVVTGYPIPTPSKQPIAWNFTDSVTALYGDAGTGGSNDLLGSPFSTPTAVQIQMTRDGIYNDVIVSGTGSYNAAGGTSGSTAPVLGEAKTTTPQSSTYVTGPVGDIPEFVSSNFILANATAQNAADNYLKAALSDAWQITITGPPVPFLDVDTVVTVTRPRVGLSTVKMVIDTLQYKVSYGDLSSITGRVVT